MASYKPNPFAGIALPAGSTSLAQYQFVTINSSGQIITPTSSGVFALVLDDAGTLSGQTLTNDMPSGGFVVGSYYNCLSTSMSWCKIKTGANITNGAAIMTDTSGHAVPQSGSGLTLGYALAASTSGDIALFAPPA